MAESCGQCRRRGGGSVKNVSRRSSAASMMVVGRVRASHCRPREQRRPTAPPASSAAEACASQRRAAGRRRGEARRCAIAQAGSRRRETSGDATRDVAAEALDASGRASGIAPEARGDACHRGTTDRNACVRTGSDAAARRDAARRDIGTGEAPPGTDARTSPDAGEAARRTALRSIDAVDRTAGRWSCARHRIDRCE